MEIGKIAIDGYNSLGSRCHVQNSEWTVFAALIARNKPGDNSPCLPDRSGTIVAMATGNKCIGPRKMCTSGRVVNDCHAEVLVKRSLRMFLTAEVYAAKNKSDFIPDERSLLMLAEVSKDGTPLYKLRDFIQLHLFVDELPCGDCSIALTSDSGEEARFTGAKLATSRGHREQTQVVGALRTKSGRSNLCVDNQSLSMSCSDKIIRWMSLGLEGTFLSKHVSEPVHLTSISVSIDCLQPTQEDREISNALAPFTLGENKGGKDVHIDCSMFRGIKDRAVRSVLEALSRGAFGRGLKFIQNPETFSVAISSRSFPFSKSRKSQEGEVVVGSKRKRPLASAGISMNWIWRPKYHDSIINPLDEKKTECVTTPEGCKLKGSYELIVQARGVLQGKRKIPKSGSIPSFDKYLRGCSISRLCKALQFERAVLLSNDDPQLRTTYTKAKAASMSEGLRKRKDCFLSDATFSKWGVLKQQYTLANPEISKKFEEFNYTGQV
mmetsp:Transcript_6621/g.11692  ORF Transcript_6621/g.11692 Transcript_6621/m.11692 type:complete len:494 (-) Transcript_6621:5974-7455(-)